MDQCFVIQPFDRDKFDQRYIDTFEPAIRKAGLNPYRVDHDPSVRIPIDEIEKNIRDSKLCFAEITTNNPNVWYELGYAFALGKDVIMVCCTDEREEEFPFDVRHRHITTYKSRSSSDFNTLSESITIKIQSYLSSASLTQELITSPIVETEGLNQQEISALIIILENQPTGNERLNIHNLVDYMGKAGFTTAATNVATRTLKRKGMIDFESQEEYHYNDKYYITNCFLTSKGEDWIIQNNDKIRVRKDSSELISNPPVDEDPDELPF